MQVPTTGIPKGAKKSTAKKSRVKMRDLPPRKNARGGSGMNRNDPPLPIPPPGFMANADEEAADGKK